MESGLSGDGRRCADIQAGIAAPFRNLESVRLAPVPSCAPLRAKRLVQHIGHADARLLLAGRVGGISAPAACAAVRILA